MSVKNIGPKTWVAGMAEERREALGVVAKEAGGAKAGRGAAVLGGAEVVPPRVIDRLGVAGVPEKVAARHAESLKGAAGDIAGIASFASTKLEPWRARSFQRIVEQFYKALGSALDAAPVATRAEVAKANVSALRTMLQKIGTADHLGSATSAAVALFELGVREMAHGVLTATPKELPTAMQDACAAVLGLAEQLSARTGLGTALNIYPVLVEQRERAEKALTPTSRRAAWSEIATFLDEVGPRSGFTQDLGANLAQALQTALDGNPGAPAAALKEAASLFRAPWAKRHQEVLDQLANRRVLGITVKSPGRPAFDALNAALETAVRGHPAANEGMNRAVYEVRSKAVEVLAQLDPAALATNPWPSIAALVARIGPTEAGPAFLTWLKPLLDSTQDGVVAQAFDRAAQADKPGALARQLAEVDLAHAGYTVADRPGLGDVLTAVAKLPPHAALAWTFAQSQPHREGHEFLVESGRVLAGLARTGGRDDLGSALMKIGAGTLAVLPQLRYYDLGGEDPAAVKVEVSAALAQASAQGPGIDDGVWPAINKLTSLHNTFPRADLKTLVGPQPGDRPGVWDLADPAVRRRHDAGTILDRLLAAMSRTPLPRSTPEVQADASRFAMHLTDVLSKLDGDFEIPLQRIEQDVEKAFNRPSALHYALRGKKASALRQGAKPGIAEFLAAHPEYPLELALTAGRNLSPEQGAWLVDRLGKAIGRDTRRQLRDFTFGVVTANKKQLIEVLQATEAPQKAVSRALSLVARAYREDKLGEVPWAQLIKGFRANVDPIGEIEQKKVEKSLAEVGLAKIPANELDARGLEEISKCGEPITYLMEHFQPGQNHDGIDAMRFREPFLGALEAVARGQWPDWRYENDSGKRQMSVWTPAQQAIWREETVTSAGAVAQPDDGDARRALQLSKGLGKAIKRDAKLDAPGLEGLGWNKPSLARAEQRHAELAAAIRDVEKGSADHKRLGGELSGVRDALSLLRLHFALQAAGEQPAAALLAIRDAVSDAMPALRHQGLDGAYAAATEIGWAARDIKSSPRQGTYAVDEDRLEPLLTSTTGGCIHYSNFRRWALSSLTANANEKIVRVYDGENFVFRAIMRFHEGKFPGYSGPVLWLNEANVNGGGSEEHRQLLLRHALSKAKALGVPLVAAHNDFTQAARALKMKVEQHNVHLKIDGGMTDAIFTDYSLDSDVRANRGDQTHWELDYQLNVIRTK